MVDPCSDRVSRAPPYSLGRFEGFGINLRGCHALRPDFPVGSASLAFLTLPGGLLPFRSPLLRESRLISFPGLLRWFTSPSCAPPPYFIQERGAGIAPGGLPHSDIRGSRDMCSSPRLFAACRVLHRLSVSRHSPCALLSLTFAFGPGSHFARIRIVRIFSSIALNLCDFSHRLLAFLIHIKMFRVIQFSRCKREFQEKFRGGTKWTRTTDLALIRRAL